MQRFIYVSITCTRADVNLISSDRKPWNSSTSCKKNNNTHLGFSPEIFTCKFLSLDDVAGQSLGNPLCTSHVHFFRTMLSRRCKCRQQIERTVTTGQQVRVQFTSTMLHWFYSHIYNVQYSYKFCLFILKIHFNRFSFFENHFSFDMN